MNAARPRLGRAVWIGLLAFALYLPGFGWGAPHATAPDRVQAAGVDDGLPLQPLADVANILDPKPDRNLGYPLMHSFTVAAAYAPYLGLLWLRGELRPSPVYPFGLADPVRSLRVLTWIGHLVSVVLAACAVASAYLAARTLWGEATGGVAALAAASIFPLFYYARTGNPDALMLCLSAVALVAFAALLRRGLSSGNAALLGAAVGFALATKEQTAAFFVGVPFVLGALELREKGRGLSRESLRAALVAAGCAFAAFGAGSGLFVDPQFFRDHLEFARTRMQALDATDTFVRSYPKTLEGHAALAALFGRYLVDSLTLPGALLGVAGLAWTLRRDAKSALLAVPAATYLAVLFFVAHVGQLRYLLPVAFVLALFAARAVTAAWSSGRPALRYGTAAVAAFAFGLSLLRGLDLTWAMIHDSRIAAGEWLAEALPPGASVEYFGASQTLPPLREDVVSLRATEYRGAIHRHDVGPETVERIRTGFRERGTEWVLLIPDHSSRPGAPYSATCPPEIFHALESGELGFERAALFETPRLLPWVRRPGLDYPTVNPPVRVYARVSRAVE